MITTWRLCELGLVRRTYSLTKGLPCGSELEALVEWSCWVLLLAPASHHVPARTDETPAHAMAVLVAPCHVQ